MAVRIATDVARVIMEELRRNLDTYDKWIDDGEFDDLEAFMQFSAEVEELREIVEDLEACVPA